VNPQRQVLREAAEWLATLQSGHASDEDQVRCQDWRRADPRHDRAYRKVEALWQRFDVLDGEATASATLSTVLGRRRRADLARRGGALALMVTVLFGGAMLAMRPFTPLDLMADYRSPVGQQRRVMLPDGSELLLNTAAVVDLAYSDGERRVRLRRGELLAEVAKDPARPFVVETDAGTARALGTRYTVRERDDRLDVVVTESAVEVCAASPAAGRARCVSTPAGHHAGVINGEVLAPRPVDTTAATAWVRGRLVADDRPLTEVLSELARYRQGFLHYDAEALAGVRVSGVFPLDEPDQALDMLAAYLPVKLVRYTPLVTLVRPVDDARR
jgi:transmembrane sensor